LDAEQEGKTNIEDHIQRVLYKKSHLSRVMMYSCDLSFNTNM